MEYVAKGMDHVQMGHAECVKIDRMRVEVTVNWVVAGNIIYRTLSLDQHVDVDA